MTEQINLAVSLRCRIAELEVESIFHPARVDFDLLDDLRTALDETENFIDSVYEQ